MLAEHAAAVTICFEPARTRRPSSPREAGGDDNDVSASFEAVRKVVDAAAQAQRAS